MKLAIIAVVLSSGCNLYFGEDTEPMPGPEPEDVTTYKLTRTRAIAGELPIVGIDSDRAGGVWVAYRKQLGDFYDPDLVRIVRLDAQGTKLVEYTYEDEHTWVGGLAFSGDFLWLSYNGVSGTNHLRKIDPATGDVVAMFATEDGIEDIAATPDGTLVMSKAHNELITIDTQLGGELERDYIPQFMYSTQRGVTVWGGNRWVASIASKDLALVDATGATIARGVNDILEDFTYSDVHLAWDGTNLLMHVHNQIMWLAVEPQLD